MLYVGNFHRKLNIIVRNLRKSFFFFFFSDSKKAVPMNNNSKICDHKIHICPTSLGAQLQPLLLSLPLSLPVCNIEKFLLRSRPKKALGMKYPFGLFLPLIAFDLIECAIWFYRTSSSSSSLTSTGLPK